MGYSYRHRLMGGGVLGGRREQGLHLGVCVRKGGERWRRGGMRRG